MPRKSTYQHYDLTKKQTARKTFSISQFLGVDYNKNALAISDANATEMNTLIYRDGVIQKRCGYENVCSIKNISGNINGVYKFIGDDGVSHLIFHIGTSLYEIYHLGKGSRFSEVSITLISSSSNKLANKESFGVPSNHRLYIFDGNSYQVLKKGTSYSFNKVEDDSETFIPTTTIGITEKDSGLSNRQAYDDVNLLSSMRRNKLITGATQETKDSYEYTLDSAINPKDGDTLAQALGKVKITLSMTRSGGA